MHLRQFTGVMVTGVMGWLAATSGVAVVAARISPAPTRSAAPMPAALPQARQRLQLHRAEVRQLQQAVARQESNSRVASERLRQQDEAIARLQRQLQAAQAPSAAAQR